MATAAPEAATIVDSAAELQKPARRPLSDHLPREEVRHRAGQQPYHRAADSRRDNRLAHRRSYRAIGRREVAGLLPGLAVEPSSHTPLRLPETEYRQPVRAARIVRGAERFEMALAIFVPEFWQPMCRPCDSQARRQPIAPPNRARAAPTVSRERSGCRFSGCGPCAPLCCYWPDFVRPPALDPSKLLL